MLFQTFGSGLKKLNFKSLSLTSRDLSEILELVPNIEHLEFGSVSIMPMHISDNHCATKQFKLRKLRKVVFKQFDGTIEYMMDILPSNIIECEIELFYMTIFPNCFRNQPNIKRLKIVSNELCRFSVDSLRSLNLDNLYISKMKKSSILNILESQRQLKHLQIDSMIDDEIFNEIGCLRNLVSLKFFTGNVSLDAFRYVSKLKKLYEISLNDFESSQQFYTMMRHGAWPQREFSQFEIICTTDLPALRRLNISLRTFFVPRETFCLLFINCFNLQHLKITTVPKANVLYGVSKWLKNLESLEIVEDAYNFTDHGSSYTENRLFEDDLKLEKLIDLKLVTYFQIDNSLLERFVFNYPNLKKLSITSEINELGNSHVEVILNGLKNLEELRLNKNCTDMNENVIKIIMENGNNLKYVHFRDSRIKVTGAVTNILKERFNKINLNHEILLQNSYK